MKNIPRILAITLLFFSLFSCKSFDKKEEKPTEIQSMQDQVIIEDQANEQPIETVANEEQAKNINAQNDEKIKEVEVKDRVFFDYNSSEINDESKKILATQIEWLKNSPQISITIEGHCDERGTREYNIALGEKRALSAKNYLISGGIDASRIKTISYGKERPAYFGSNEAIWSQNRRAVVVVN